MRGLMVTFLFYNIIAHTFQHPMPQNSINISINAVEKALQSMGIKASSVDWKCAFARLVKRYEQKDQVIREKDQVIRRSSVLNFIRTHMESFSLQTDPLHYRIKGSSSTLVTMTMDDIAGEDIPSSFQGRLEADFKTAYVRWYRIIKNSNDPRIKVLLNALKNEQLCEKTPLSEQDIAKTLAVIWCTVCNAIHSLLGVAKGQIIWIDADEVADAFGTFQENRFYVDFVRIFFKETKFRDRSAITKYVANQ